MWAYQVIQAARPADTVGEVIERADLLTLWVINVAPPPRSQSWPPKHATGTANATRDGLLLAAINDYVRSIVKKPLE